jgi:hypothetical protein
MRGAKMNHDESRGSYSDVLGRPPTTWVPPGAPSPHILRRMRMKRPTSLWKGEGHVWVVFGGCGRVEPE